MFTFFEKVLSGLVLGRAYGAHGGHILGRSPLLAL